MHKQKVGIAKIPFFFFPKVTEIGVCNMAAELTIMG